MAQSRTLFIKAPVSSGPHSIPVNEFDTALDEGYELITIITPKGRYTASLDDWLDFGYIDLADGDTEVRVLHQSYMSKS